MDHVRDDFVKHVVGCNSLRREVFLNLLRDRGGMVRGLPITSPFFVAVDGREGSQYDDIVVAREVGGVIFDSPNQLHYVARKGNAFYLVEEQLG